MAVVVSDASVLICLGAVAELRLLREFYQEILVPNAVWAEVTSAASLPGANETLEAKQQGWLKVQTPQNQSLVATLQIRLVRENLKPLLWLRKQPPLWCLSMKPKGEPRPRASD